MVGKTNNHPGYTPGTAPAKGPGWAQKQKMANIEEGAGIMNAEKRKLQTKQWLKREGVYLKDLAQKAGVSAPVTHRYFQKKYTIAQENAERIQEALREMGCPTEYLPPEALPIQDCVREFEVPLRLPVKKQLDMVSQGIADLGRATERRLYYMGAQRRGSRVVFRYLEQGEPAPARGLGG